MLAGTPVGALTGTLVGAPAETLVAVLAVTLVGVLVGTLGVSLRLFAVILENWSFDEAIV